MNSHRGRILRLLPNRVWRTYNGGLQLDKMAGGSHPADGAFPEDWIGSTIRATNPGARPADEGLARVSFNDTNAVLADLLAADPVYFLGAAHVGRFGNNPMLLVKYLDAAVRLPFQVHPTIDFSRARLQADSGKTEAYYVLAARPEVSQPCIYLGFQHPPRRAELARMIATQDIAGLTNCFEPIPVSPGDVFVVPGGRPHAIGAGILIVEVMEPTDFVARIEFYVNGRTIPEPARFMGRDLEFALDMFNLEPLPRTAVDNRWRCQPRTIVAREGLCRESLVDERVTTCFRIQRTTVTTRTRWQPDGFTILLLVQGSCLVATEHGAVSMATFDRVLIPHGLGEIELEPGPRAVFLECLPPRA